MSKKKGKKSHKNPLGISLNEVKKQGGSGAALAAGALLTKVVWNHLSFLPASLSSGAGETVGRSVLAYLLGKAASKAPIAIVKQHADDFAKGGIAAAIYEFAAPQVVPALAFTDYAKAHSQIVTVTSALAQQSQKQIADGGQAPAATNGVGDAFVLSRGGLTTADRSPRDTAALAGVGDAYARERTGFSGAPNGLRGPWGRSIYAN